MAKYLKALPARNKDEAAYAYTDDGQKGPADADGKASPAMVYSQRCGSCHSDNGKGQNLYIAPLAGNPSVMDPDPTSLINIVLTARSRFRLGHSRPLQDAAIQAGADRPGDCGHRPPTSARVGNDTKGVAARDVGAIRAATDFVRYKSQILTMQ